MAWTLKRLAISAFVLVHLAAVGLWNLPRCALTERFGGWTPYYMLPTGLWQHWGMFAPDPVRDTWALEAVVRDRSGIQRRFGFLRTAELSAWEGFWAYRHGKFLANMADKTGGPAFRELTARHAVRRLGLAAEDFPVEVELLYQVRTTPPPGQSTDPMMAPLPLTLDVYRFANPREAQP